MTICPQSDRGIKEDIPVAFYVQDERYAAGAGMRWSGAPPLFHRDHKQKHPLQAHQGYAAGAGMRWSGAPPLFHRDHKQKHPLQAHQGYAAGAGMRTAAGTQEVESRRSSCRGAACTSFALHAKGLNDRLPNRNQSYCV